MTRRAGLEGASGGPTAGFEGWSGHCDVAASADCGARAPPKSEGTACEDTDQCAQGLVCRGGSCGKLGGAGAPCSDTAENCEFGLVCNGGKCAAPDVGAVGAPCDPQSDASCDQSRLLYCNPVSSQCEEIAFADEGQPCGYDLETGKVTVCSGSGTCAGASEGEGSCVAPAKDGGACSEAPEGPGCLPPAECTGGTCQVEEPATCG